MAIGANLTLCQFSAAAIKYFLVSNLEICYPLPVAGASDYDNS